MAQKIDRRVLEQRIQEVEGLSSEERSALLELLHTKKYGLVWEDKPEDVEERLRESLPVLKEDKELALAKGGENAPNHILIEGDNLEALTALTYTHEGKIDVIYIDPPYNMGEKDFYYNDSYVDIDDPFIHTKWLCFMNKRLRIAHKLLSSQGVIFISIDDHEQAVLTILCDEIFGRNNFISNSFVVDNLKGKANDNFITNVGSRLVIYAKSKSTIEEVGFCELENVFGEQVEEKFKKQDEQGFYNLVTFKKTGQSKFRKDRPLMFYPILEKNHTLFAISEDEYSKLYNKGLKEFDDEFLATLKEKYNDYNFILPVDSSGQYLRWTSGFLTFCKKMNSEIVYDGDIKQKTRPSAKEMTQIYASGTPKNFMYNPSYSIGTDDLKSVMGETDFPFPKPLQLIKDILLLNIRGNITILDFFAGSGTTLHATMQLNAEDGGKRQCILVTNNENNICRDVTYERNKRVINGYTTPKGVEVEGLKGNNLRYYRTEFVDRDSSMTNKRKLMAAATELLNIKQDIYKEVHTFGSLKLRSHIARYFAERGKQMLIIYKVEAIEYLVKEIAQMPADTHILIYVFSINNYAMDADFEDVADKVTLCALPAAIYNAYLKVLPKKKAEVAVEESEEKSNEEPLLFPEEDEQ